MRKQFLKLTLQTKWITPSERALKTVLENDVRSCVHFCLRSLWHLERCDHSYFGRFAITSWVWVKSIISYWTLDVRKYYQSSNIVTNPYSHPFIMVKFPALGIIIIACIAKLIWVWSHQMTYLDAQKSLLPELEVANDTFCDELFGSCTVMGEFFEVRRIILKL